MVSLLTGIELLRGFGFYAVVFPFILITAIVYAILSKVEILGDNTNINIIVSVIVGFIFISFLPAVAFLHLLIPYIVIMFVVIMFILLLFMFMGVDMSTLQEIYQHPGVYGVIIGVFVLSIFITLSMALPPLAAVDVQPGQPAPGSGVQQVAPGYEYELPDTGGTDSSGRLTTVEDDDVENKLAESRRSWQEETIFHPTMLALMIMLIVFGVTTYVVTAVRE